MGSQTQAGGGEASSPLTLFRVRVGCRFGAMNQHGPGDVVELPASALIAFGDKLEPIAVAVEDAAVPDEPKPRKRGKEAK